MLCKSRSHSKVAADFAPDGATAEPVYFERGLKLTMTLTTTATIPAAAAPAASQRASGAKFINELILLRLERAGRVGRADSLAALLLASKWGGTARGGRKSAGPSCIMGARLSLSLPLLAPPGQNGAPESVGAPR